MRAKLLTRRMVVVHLIAIAAVTSCVFLGLWQWGRAAVRHSAQNGFYAFEWWSFALIMIVVWVRTLQDELKPAPHPEAFSAALPTTGPREAVAEEPDEEVAAYNSYLAWLAANPRD